MELLPAQSINQLINKTTQHKLKPLVQVPPYSPFCDIIKAPLRTPFPMLQEGTEAWFYLTRNAVRR